MYMYLCYNVQRKTKPCLCNELIFISLSASYGPFCAPIAFDVEFSELTYRARHVRH